KKPTNKKVATIDASEVLDKADALYRDKKFGDAARLLDSTARNTDASTARDLKLKSTRYLALGKAYNNGMAPATDPIVAYESLKSARNYDQIVGKAFESEITTKLGQVAPKAAIQYVIDGKLNDAHTAVILAEEAGATNNSTVKAVRQKLETEAGKLYAEAMKEL